MFCCCVVIVLFLCVFSVCFFKQKTAYEMRISDWSSDVCSSDLGAIAVRSSAGMCRVIVSADADYMSLRAGGRRRFIYRKMEIVGRRAGVNLGFGLDIWRLCC